MWLSSFAYLIGMPIPFFILLLERYLRFVVNAVAHWNYKSIRPMKYPSYTSKDVTIILPTISTDSTELRRTIKSMLACNPCQVLLVTTKQQYESVQELSKTIDAENLKVLQSPIANKRRQICEATPLVGTDITVLVDDDVTWPRTILPWLLAPFEDKHVGAVGTCQRVRRLKKGTLMQLCFNWLGAVYIERRNFEISATHNIDGGTSCMSGRTCALRTAIVQEPAFKSGYQTEGWRGKLLNADDDNFITRWLVAEGWMTWIQSHPQCEIETTLENSFIFLYQCTRWARSNWRSNLTSLFKERHIWGKQPWSTYALHLTMFMNFAIVIDPWLFWSCYESTSSKEESVKIFSRMAFLVWWLATKNIKVVGLYRRNIWDIRFLPISVFFGYFHSLIKLWALLTMDQTGWGSR